MKKILSTLAAAFMVLSLAACSELPQKENFQPETSEKEPSQQEQTFGINETAVFDELKITALEIKESKGTEFFQPESGNTFVGIKFVIENVSESEQTVSSLLMFDSYANDVKCDYSFSAACVFDEGTIDGSIAPGKKLVGWYALEVPADWTTIELNVEPSLFSNSLAVFVFEK
ncbi:MAG: DUF4352 domain-containing protein [Clostridia bacterium]|nr:DUF4352 domain-containing protein [Clostridia bacterium]